MSTKGRGKMAAASDEETSLGSFSPPGSVGSSFNDSFSASKMMHSPGSGICSPESCKDDSDQPPRKKPRRAPDDKMCGVCGDKALGCNFDAISCESCKAFFRRNALKDKKTKCLFEGNCKIDSNTRRFCPHCRLNKCFTVGMKKELILGNDERKKRMEKVIKNRKAKRPPKGEGSDVKMENDGPSTGPPTPATPSPLPETSNLTLNIDGLDGEQITVSQAPRSTTENVYIIQPTALDNIPATGQDIALQLINQVEHVTPTSMPTPAGGSMLMTPDMDGSQIGNESCNLLVMSKHNTINPVALAQENNLFTRNLLKDEQDMLQELQQVYDLSFTVDIEPLIHIRQIDPSLTQLLNQSSITVLRIIKFAKRLEEFYRLPQECQIGILKGAWIHILLLRSVSLYDTERDVWVTPKGEIPSGILKNATGFVQLHDDHVQYCKSIKSVIKNDIMLVTIMQVIVLFSPEGQHVFYRQIVSNIQDKYLLLLKHYCESKYGFQVGAAMFPQLMTKLKELKDLAVGHGRYLLEVNPREIEPIMLEILDLK